MTTTSTEKPTAEPAADLETEHLFGHPLPQCPRCGNRHLETVVDDETRDVNFFCGMCDRCWRIELGFAHPIPSGACLRSSKRDIAESVLVGTQEVKDATCCGSAGR